MDEELKIAICEDTREDADKLLELLGSCRIPTCCTVFSSGEALLEVYRPQMFDLLLMDIYMTGLTGVETVARIRELDETVPVAFLTTSTEFTLESYRLNVLRYIEKPCSRKAAEDILRLARMEKESAPSLLVRRSGREEHYRLSEILYLEQQTHHVNLNLAEGETVQLSEKLSELAEQLEDAGFFQPHKSFYVNLDFVRFIDPELRCFVLQNGKNIPIRRESMSKARQAMKDYLFRRTRGGAE